MYVQAFIRQGGKYQISEKWASWMVTSGGLRKFRLSDIASGAFLGTEVSVLGLEVQDVLWNESFAAIKTVLYKCSGNSLPCLVLNNGTMR